LNTTITTSITNPQRVFNIIMSPNFNVQLVGRKPEPGHTSHHVLIDTIHAQVFGKGGSGFIIKVHTKPLYSYFKCVGPQE